jgi:hypothetical protein
VQNGHCLVLAIALADPLLAQAEFGRGRGRMGRPEVVGAKNPGMDVVAIETAELANCALWLGCSGSMAAEISS